MTVDVACNRGASLLLAALRTYQSGVSGPPGMIIPCLFIGCDLEAALRAHAVRRIAYMVFVADPDVYGSKLPLMLESIHNVLRLSEPPLFVKCLFCMRELLLRTGPYTRYNSDNEGTALFARVNDSGDARLRI